VSQVVDVFSQHDGATGAAASEKGFGSDKVLALLASDLRSIGFEVEAGRATKGRIERPVFFGEGGEPSLRYQVDAYHSEWRCGLEVEAGRGFMGNALYRDLVQAMVMVQVDHLCVALLNRYEFSNSYSEDYRKAIDVADALFGHDRVRIPFGLTVIGYGPA
jgi:hypothetical protein